MLPETARRPLEEMRALFAEAPWFVPTMDGKKYAATDLEHRVEEIEQEYGQKGV